MAKHFIGVDDYKISPTWKAPGRKKSSIALGLLALYALKRYNSSKKKGGSGSGGRKILNQANDTRQRCTVKMHYSKSMEAHKEQINRYLVKEGKGKEGTAPVLYGTSEEEYRKNMSVKNFRIFLSPASNTIPLQTLTKTFVASLEAQTGYQLYWIAAEHYDTAHHHVHLLINGQDKNGKDVFFPPDMVKTFMRENACNICTSLVGSRTKEDLALEKEGAITANRYTYLDERINEQMKDAQVGLNYTGRDRENINRRLDHLRSLGLCRFEVDKYIFNSEWEKTLKTNGRYNAFISSRKALKYTNEQNLLLYDGKQGSVSGIITKIYKTDEVSDNHAILLESIDGKAYFIPLFRKPSVSGGQTVEVIPEKNQKGRLVPKVYKRSQEDLAAECSAKDYRKGFAVQVQRATIEPSRNGMNRNM